MPYLYFEHVPGASTKVLSDLGYALARRLADVQIVAFGEHGKPYFIANPYCHFSLSHSGESFALITHDAPIGIDIERLRHADFKIARRFFTQDEQDYVDGDNFRFFEIWTKKEAYVKYTGEGLSRPFSSFSVFKLDGLVFESRIRDGFMISICAERLKERVYLSYRSFQRFNDKKIKS